MTTNLDWPFPFHNEARAKSIVNVNKGMLRNVTQVKEMFAIKPLYPLKEDDI